MTKLTLIKGDITTLNCDAIVNAANSALAGGGGVDGAIHRAGGTSIMEECRKIGGCPTGEAVITNAGKLPAKYVIHTVGPIWRGGSHNETQLLTDCYANSLILAAEKGIKSIAFPNISTGVYGFPKPQAANLAISIVKDYVAQHPTQFDEIVFVCFDEENFDLYGQVI